MQLIFDRRVSRRTPGRFRTRVLTEGVVPSLHVEYKKSKVKQYHKEGQALRTETTINDTYDFDIGRALRNLPALREIGFAANRRLLHVESLSHDCLIGEDRLRRRHATRRRPRPTRRRAPLRRPPRARPHAGALSLCPRPHRLSPSGRCATHVAQLLESRSRDLLGGRDDLRPASPAAPWPHRTGPAQPSLSHHPTRRTRSPCSTPASTRGRFAPPARLQPVGVTSRPAGLRSARRRARPFPGGGQTCGLKNLTQTLILLGVKTPSEAAPQNREHWPSAWRRVAFLIALMIVASPGGALRGHHSLAGVYDSANRVSIEGLVSEFHFVNPHPFVTVTVKAGGGRSDRVAARIGQPVRAGGDRDDVSHVVSRRPHHRQWKPGT